MSHKLKGFRCTFTFYHSFVSSLLCISSSQHIHAIKADSASASIKYHIQEIEALQYDSVCFSLNIVQVDIGSIPVCLRKYLHFASSSKRQESNNIFPTSVSDHSFKLHSIWSSVLNMVFSERSRILISIASNRYCRNSLSGINKFLNVDVFEFTSNNC